MLNSGEKFRALRDKNLNILAIVLSEKKTKLNGRSLKGQFFSRTKILFQSAFLFYIQFLTEV